MSLNQLAQPPTRTRVHPAARHALDESARLEPAARRPRMMRMPADWWDSPSAVGCPLSKGPQSARAARRLTRNTLREWGLPDLAEEAGRGLRMVDALIDVWGWSPVAGRGKAVWAVLFCA